MIRRWSVGGTFAEVWAHLGLAIPRQWWDWPIACTTPVLLALFSIVTVSALQLSQGAQILLPMTAWYYKAEPTFANCLTLGCHQFWRAQCLVNSAAETEFIQIPRETFGLLINGLPLAA